MFKTGKKLEKLEESIITLAKRQEEQQAAVQQEMNHLGQEFRKHDLAISDMLDTWEEIREAQEEKTEDLQAELLEKTREEAEALREREDALTDALISCFDQIFDLSQAAEASGDGAWIRQLQLSENVMREKSLAAGLVITGNPGELFSYEIHEPVERLETDQADRHMTVARVYHRGYWLQGKMIRKARVAVYMQKEEQEE